MLQLGLTTEVALIAVRFDHHRLCRHFQQCDVVGSWEESSRPLPHPPVHQVDDHGCARSGALEREQGAVPVMATGRRWQEQFAWEAYGNNYLFFMFLIRIRSAAHGAAAHNASISQCHRRGTVEPLHRHSPCHRSASAACCVRRISVTATVAQILQVLLLRVVGSKQR